MTAPDTSTPAKKTAVAFENKHRNSTLEHGVLIADDGCKLFERTGLPDCVYFTHGELNLVGHVTLSHNHPRGSGPSLADVRLAAQYEFRELRVVTATERYFVDGIRSSHLPRLQQEYEIALQQAINECRFAVFNNTIRPSQLSCEVLHGTWARVHMILKFNYRREPS